MKIELTQPYQAISEVDTSELPDFAVLIGRNGAGKSQLLEALKVGHAQVAGVQTHQIELFDMASFRSPNSAVAGRAANQFARTTADAYLTGTSTDPAPVEIAAEVFGQFAETTREVTNTDNEGFAANLRDTISQLPDFAVFPQTGAADSYQHTIYARVIGPLIPSPNTRNRRQSQPAPNSCNGNPAILITLAMKLAQKLPHELDRDDIMRAGQYEGSIISNVVSEVFATYKVDQFIWAHKRVETESIPFATILAEYRRKYPPPWDILRDVLSSMRTAAGDDGLFNFEFSDPEQHKLHMGNYEQFQFQTQMTNRTSGAQYNLDTLSSGEKVLMALCLSSFNQRLGRRRPKLLLLDELDAVLHPSMVSALVTTLKELYVAHGTKVIFTSHSPMTVAALAETEIFRVVRTDGRVRVRPTTKIDAIDELSEGIATVDAGLRIAAYDDAQVTILTEGHNARHLKRWVELNFPKGVHVFDQLADHTNKSQLLAYGRLLASMDPVSHFVIVWDCDAAHEAHTLQTDLRENAKVTPFALRRRSENKIARRGIENNYDDSVLQPYAITKTDSRGRVLAREFDNSRKTEFADHVRQCGTGDYFVHFEELREVVGRVLLPRTANGDRR
ncbi:MAG: ATP-binding protein [Gammaproteobacteria bacterium]|nr:ATP-binding protein [Gammaproteobacteria bacterium]